MQISHEISNKRLIYYRETKLATHLNTNSVASQSSQAILEILKSIQAAQLVLNGDERSVT